MWCDICGVTLEEGEFYDSWETLNGQSDLELFTGLQLMEDPVWYLCLVCSDVLKDMVEGRVFQHETVLKLVDRMVTNFEKKHEVVNRKGMVEESNRIATLLVCNVRVDSKVRRVA